MIQTTNSKIHWNYFIALEHDAETVSRYIEFNDENFDVYSIELAHILFAAASEVDVMAKMLCKHFDRQGRYENILHYRPTLLSKLPELPTMEVTIPRYGLKFKPWVNWSDISSGNPIWWDSYNKVKHQRNTYFNRATLKNALNALGGLLILIYYYYSYELAGGDADRLFPKETMRELEPHSTLFSLPQDYYYSNLIV